MIRILKGASLSGFALLLAFATTANAQEEQAIEPLEACTLTPAAIEADLPGTPVDVTPPQTMGEITELDGADSGLALAEPDPNAERDLIAEGEAQEPVETDQLENIQTLWLSTSGVEPGTYEVTLKSETDECTAEVLVYASSSEALEPEDEAQPESGMEPQSGAEQGGEAEPYDSGQ